MESRSIQPLPWPHQRLHCQNSRNWSSTLFRRYINSNSRCSCSNNSSSSNSNSNNNNSSSTLHSNSNKWVGLGVSDKWPWCLRSQTSVLHDEGFLSLKTIWWCSWLRHCTTNQKDAGSIPDGVTGIFHWFNPSGRTVALGFTQCLIEISTRDIPWGVNVAGV